MTNQTVKTFILEHENELIDMRRYLHTHPELSMEEYETTKYVAQQLDALGVDYRVLEGDRGLIAEISGPKKGKTILLRADMDALPINELNDHLEYKSVKPGVMHACGHDSHTAMLIFAVKALLEVKDQIKGTIRFIFQPAEEVAEGAKIAMAQGVLDNVDNAFGIHIWSNAPTGYISCPVGPSFAATDEFHVTFEGKGGHGAMPHLSHDAVIMATEYTNAVQTLISRTIDPLEAAVITVGKIEAGDRWNVIANDAKLSGTVRSYSPVVRALLEEKMKLFADHIAAMHEGTAVFEYYHRTDPVNNDKEPALLVEKVAIDAFGADSVHHEAPTMGGEDFGFYLTNMQGAFATVGCANPDLGSDYPHHHPRFNVDESSLKIGAELYAQYALAYLAQDAF
ncbi:M20 metallopeptidase family protein [Fundicoccus culcitae]|uniref:Amidohydrolase n=1 Tax=Fundicoccus culcitae TaxID=2969821 RepID=A0ABY5P4S5_9LACT|nr:amidohydrolase [Fundicoccus culcitae]UUX33742.1 amidohydrolase [Fundicoccus culcitae]